MSDAVQETEAPVKLGIHDQIMANVAKLRRRRGWSRNDLAAEITQLFPTSDITFQILATMELRITEVVSAERLFYFAAVFRTNPQSLALTDTPVCVDCYNSPGPGTTCNTCGIREERFSGDGDPFGDL